MGLGIRDRWRLFNLYRRREEVFEKLSSRKLWAAVVGATLTAFGGELGMNEDTTTHIVQIVVGYIVGQGVVDAAKAAKGGK